MSSFDSHTRGKSEVPIHGKDGSSGGQDLSPKIIFEKDFPDKLGFAFSERRKWGILLVIALVQTSMNLNASIYGNAIDGLRFQYHVPASTCRLGMAIFLISYAFGCELWAPWSEESGRKQVMQMSLGFVNLWQIPQIIVTATCGASQAHVAMPIIIIFRFLGGLSSAGGSVTLGMVADMWESEEQQYSMAFVVMSSVMGSIVGPIVGGVLESYAPPVFIFIFQLLLGVIVQSLHALYVPETRSSVILKHIAHEQRQNGENVRTKAELDETPLWSSLGFRRTCTIWWRPFHMFITEPIVLALSLISGFSDALIFTFLESLPLVMRLWDFEAWQMGLCFLPIGLGYLFAWAYWASAIYRRNQARKSGVELTPESRLEWLLWMAPLLPIAILPFAWTGTGPPQHWIVPLTFLVFIGMANYAIYGATVDYMVATYGDKYSASATGGNGFARDLLAGVSAFYTKSLYSNVGREDKHLQMASTILGCIAIPLIVPIYVFYWYGSSVRGWSRFANEVKRERARASAHHFVRSDAV